TPDHTGTSTVTRSHHSRTRPLEPTGGNLTTRLASTARDACCEWLPVPYGTVTTPQLLRRPRATSGGFAADLDRRYRGKDSGRLPSTTAEHPKPPSSTCDKRTNSPQRSEEHTSELQSRENL